jgi:hypothetical protein
MNIIYIEHFLHLFELEQQYKACKRIVSLLRPEKGVLIVVQRIWKVKSGRMLAVEGKMTYKHSPETFERCVKGLVTGIEWEVRATLDPGLGISQIKGCRMSQTVEGCSLRVERVKRVLLLYGRWRILNGSCP